MTETAPGGLRDYGLPASEMICKPFAKLPKDPVTCANCGCEQVMVIVVKVKQPLLRGGIGSGTYMGCPACPWASPMATVATATKKENES